MIKLFKKIYILIIFLFFLIFSYLQFSKTCNIYPHIFFDSQAVLTWDYSASQNMLPYKDVFYPYGVFPYYKNQIPILNYIYILLLPLFFTLLYWLLDKLFKNKIISLLASGFFFIFTNYFPGMETLIRYGPVTISGIYFSYLFFKQRITLKNNFLLGICNGLMFSLMPDIGMYTTFVYIFLLLFFKTISQNNIYTYITTRALGQRANNQNSFMICLKNFLLPLIIEIGVMILGFIIGCIPILSYLINSHALINFLLSFQELPNLALLAKTPFLHSLKSPESIFILFSIFLTVYSLSYKYIILKNKKTLLTYYQLSTITTMILLEQKGIIRSLDRALTFIAVLLLFFLIYDIYIFLRKKSKKAKFITSILCLALSLIIIRYFNLNSVFSKRSYANEKQCIQNNLTNINKQYPQYQLIFRYLKNQKEFNGKIFSFPGDPVFYIYFKQKPPFYFSGYESSPDSSQNTIIKYIESNNIYYVIYNLSLPAIQDEVPNYIRNAAEMKYLLLNYTPIQKIDHFLILKRNTSTDIFSVDLLTTLSEFRNYLLSINLANIPKSEGHYKSHFIKMKEIIPSTTLDVFNTILKINNISSKNTFLIITPLTSQDKITTLKISTNEGLQTSVSFYSCSKLKACIIHLDNLPLFYKNRILKILTFNKKFPLRIELIKNPEDKSFW